MISLLESQGLISIMPIYIADLETIASKRNGNQQAMCEALRKWEKFIRDFTYRSLLEILIGLREGALADQVCRTCELLYK